MAGRALTGSVRQPTRRANNGRNNTVVQCLYLEALMAGQNITLSLPEKENVAASVPTRCAV